MTKIKLILIIFLIISFLNNYAFIFAQNDNNINAEIKKINRQIQIQKNKIEKIKEQQQIYSQAIQEKHQEKATLNNQIVILDNRIVKAELDIENTEIELNRTNLEIQKVNIEIDNQNNNITTEKKHLTNILQLLQKQGRVGILEILLLNNSLVDFLNQLKYLEDINSETVNSLNKLKKYKIQLEKNKSDLDQKNQELIYLKQSIEEKLVALQNEQNNKLLLINQVQNSEKEYQRLLTQAKREQQAASADIVELEKSVRAKLNSYSKQKLTFNDSGLIWPVLKNVITAYFHDPEYPYRYIFEHPAIDIRAEQGTIVRAAASGYVARTKLDGSNYGYIMLIHGDELSTVYGHISKIFVKEDEYVIQGQEIGLSGGLPGTPGAGRLTTGPHLHFEVRLNGIPVNPLEYLQ